MTFGLLRLLTILDRVPLPILPAFSSQCSQPLTLDLAAPAAFHLSLYNTMMSTKNGPEVQHFLPTSSHVVNQAKNILITSSVSGNLP